MRGFNPVRRLIVLLVILGVFTILILWPVWAMLLAVIVGVIQTF